MQARVTRPTRSLEPAGFGINARDPPVALPGRSQRAGRRNVLGIAIAETAHAAKGRQALLKGHKTAVLTAALLAAVGGTPGIVLRVRRVAKLSGGKQNSERQNRRLHNWPRGFASRRLCDLMQMDIVDLLFRGKAALH